MTKHLGLCALLLSLLLLTGCLPVSGAEIIFSTRREHVSSGTSAATAEPTRSKPTHVSTEPVPELETEAPDAGLRGTAMQLSCNSTVSADNPDLSVSVCFSQVDLTGAPEGRICS